MPRITAVPVHALVFLLVTSIFLSGCSDTAVPVQESGTVRILSSPSGAAVYLDGEYRGTTPASVNGLPAGSHTLEVRANGYERWSAPVTVIPGGIVNITAVLSAVPVTAVTVTSATATIAPVSRGQPEIHLDGYWIYQQGAGSTENPVPLIVHAEGFNVGDSDAREVTASANLYYGGRTVCWKTVYLGTLKAGGHVATDSMVSCSLPSNLKNGDLALRFENIVVTG